MPVSSLTSSLPRFTQTGITSQAWVRVKSFLTKCILIYVLLLGLPPLPGPVGTGLDASWGYALNMAHAAHLAFGREFIFTYGPLGYLTVPDPQFTGPGLVIASLLLMYAVYCYGLVQIFRRVHDWGTALVIAGAIAVGTVWAHGAPDRLELAFLVFALAVAVRRKVSIAELAVAGMLASLLFLIKANDGISAYALVFLLCGRELIDRVKRGERGLRQFAVVAVAATATLVVGFGAAQGSFSSFFAFLRFSGAIASGYSEAMSTPGPYWQCGIGLISIVALCLLPWLAERPKQLVLAMPIALILAFFAWKHAMVRQDGHADLFHVKLAVAALFVLVAAETARDRNLVMTFVVLNLGVNLVVLEQLGPQCLHLGYQTAALEQLSGTVKGYFSPVESWASLRNSNREALAGRQLPAAIVAQADGESIDILPHHLDYLRAAGWKWHGRPVIQSYVAYTPALDRLNADYFERPRAPRNIVLEWDAIDGRQPLLDDSASWRSVFNWYDVAVKSERFYLLNRRSEPRFSAPIPISSAETQWDQELAVPQVRLGDEVIMAADIGHSAMGVLRGFLFRLDAISVEATYASGRVVRGRVTRANLANGALIGHLPQSLGETLPYFGERMPGLPDRIISVKWVSAGESEYTAPIHVSFARLPLRNQVNDAAPEMKLTSLWEAGQPIAGQQGANSVTALNTLIVQPVNTDPQVTFDAHRDLRTYSTIVVRARFSTGDRINLFFGRQVEGRGFEGWVPAANRWLDVYIDAAANPFWSGEAGTQLRFDPSSDRSLGATIEIAGVFGSTARMPQGSPAMTFYPAASAP